MALTYAVTWVTMAVGVSVVSVHMPEELVQTTSGWVRGTSSNAEVVKYLGIPFAENPEGDRRFKPAEIKRYTDKEIDARSFGPICPQNLFDLPPDYSFLDGNYTMAEDCLVLNLYVPAQSAYRDSRKAVMVYIHGGGYMVGTGNTHDGSLLAGLNDVIVVTINYRLGVLGFLNTMDEHAPGNLGLRDQILALHWIQNNIAKFGGDPDRVTVFGVSAGGSSVTQLALSPMARGLFRRIIAQSGNPLAPWSYERYPLQAAKHLAKRVACPTNSTEVMVDCLQQKSVEDILKAETVNMTGDDKVHWVPTYDNEFFPFTEHDLKYNVSNLPVEIPLTNIDMIIGHCSQEGAGFFHFFVMSGEINLGTDEGKEGITEEVFNRFISPVAKSLGRGTEDGERYFNSLLKYRYTEWTRPKNGLARLAEGLRLHGEVSFEVSAVEFARLHAMFTSGLNGTRRDSSAGGATYFYRFDKRGGFMTDHSWITGASHLDDLAFVFGYPLAGEVNMVNTSADEKKLSQEVMTYWTNFAKTGDPNQPYASVKWPPFDRESETYMNLEVGLSGESVHQHINADNVAFWTDLIPQHVRLLTHVEGRCQNSRELEEKVSDYDMMYSNLVPVQ